MIPPLPPLAAAPAGATDRIAGLDAVRGLALLGILLMNIEAFNGPLWLSGAGVDPRWSGTDRWLDAFVYVVVQGSFFPLFSLLFGIGSALMAGRLAARGLAFGTLHLRRMGVLAAIGLLHGVLVWSGDILLSYALLGCLLPLFVRWPARWLALAGVAGIGLAAGLVLLVAGVFWVMAHSPEAAAGLEAAAGAARQDVAAQAQAMSAGSFGQALRQRAADVVANLQSLPLVGGQLLGLFLLGMALVRRGALQAPADHARLWAALRWGAWPAGLLLGLLGLWLSPFNPPWALAAPAFGAQALKIVAGSLMGLGWLAWGLHLARWLAPLAPAGRMSLTTYLVQSLVGTAVFCGYGLGLYGRLDRTGEVLFALGLYALQVLAARAWLARFRQGPAEWAWRCATYGRRLPLRRGAEQ